jgi:glycerol-3-phosphate acyltransferase PlsY
MDISTGIIITKIGLLAFGYLMGSIPFGLLLMKVFGHGDIRLSGSGNIGATNVLRSGHKWLALFTLILDSGKGAFAVLMAMLFLGEYDAAFMLITGFGAIAGHCFPVWLGFKGGKGVATTFGTVLAAVPYAGLGACAIWLLTAFTTRISSLSALVAMLAMPVMTYFMRGALPACIAILITLLVFIRHKDNIKRILNGNETKIGDKKKHEKPVSDAAQ